MFTNLRIVDMLRESFGGFKVLTCKTILRSEGRPVEMSCSYNLSRKQPHI